MAFVLPVQCMNSPGDQLLNADCCGACAHAGSTPTIVWLSIIRRAHEARHQLEVAQATARGQPAPPRRLLPAANGEQLFGLAHAEVQRLLGWGTQAGEQPPTA